MSVLLEIKNLEKVFYSGSREIWVLRGIDFSMREGEIVSIVGESGAGKTTFIQVIGTIDKPTRGEIYFKGKELTKFTDRELDDFRNKNLGFVFQFHHLLMEFSALENVAMPALIMGRERDVAFEKAASLLEFLGLKDRLHHRPGELSGGEQQRVAIARALINEPSLVLADEPTGNLDLKTQEVVFQLFLNIVREHNSSLLIATHNLNLAKKTDRIFELSDGKLKELS